MEMADGGHPRDNVPRLEGWVSFDELADKLGISKQAVHKMLETDRIKTARKVGKKAIYVLTQDEANALCEARLGNGQGMESAEEVSLPGISFPETISADLSKPVLVDVL